MCKRVMEDHGKYFEFQEGQAISSDTDFILPPLEPATLKKVNTWNYTEQQRFEKIEKQLKKRQEERKLQISHDQRQFIRSSLIFRRQNKQRVLNAVALSQDFKLETAVKPEDSDDGKARIFPFSIREIWRPPFLLPPLSRSVCLNAKDMQTQKDEMGRRMNDPDINAIKHCRYLRLNDAQEKEMLDENQNGESKAES